MADSSITAELAEITREVAASDRRLRWRRLLAGVGQPAARRLRARPDRQGAPQGLLPGHRQRRRRRLRRSLLQGVRRSRAEASHLGLFKRRRGIADVREHLLSQDLIYVGGGSLVSLLGVWQGHGIDAILRDAWRKGIVLCGLSAGALCWFDRALTAYYGPPERIQGLGILPGASPRTTTPSQSGATSSTAGSTAGCRPVLPLTTAPRCTSSATALHKVVSSRPSAPGLLGSLRRASGWSRSGSTRTTSAPPTTQSRWRSA